MKDRPLKRIDALPDHQRQQLVQWLLTGTLEKAGELLTKEFGVEIPTSTLYRFRQRCEVTDYLDTSEDSARARVELINGAASGKPNFCQATVDLLEKQAFDLAHAATRDQDAMDALKNLFTLTNAHRNTAVRERMATVQEQKAQLREQELELKKSQKSAHSALSIPNSALSDPLGPPACNLDEIEERARKKFKITDEHLAFRKAADLRQQSAPEESPNPSIQPVPSAPEPLSPASSLTLSQSSPHGVPNSWGQADAHKTGLINTGLQSGDSATPTPTTASAVSLSSPAAEMDGQDERNKLEAGLGTQSLSDPPAANPCPSELSAAKPSPQFQILNSQFSILNEGSAPGSSLPASVPSVASVVDNSSPSPRWSNA